MKRFLKRKFLFMPLTAWLAIIVLLVVGGLVGAYVFAQVTSESEVVEPYVLTNQVDFDEQIWPCYSTFLTFDVENEAPVPYGLRLTPDETIFPENVHFGELLVSGDPYSWGDVAEMPANGTVSVSIEVVAECDAGEGPVSVTINVERLAPGAVPTPTPTPPPAPEIGFSPSSFDFEAGEGGANPASQTLGIWNAGTGTLDWSVGDDAAWLDLAPTSGTSTGETDDVTVSVDISGMSVGVYDANITISAPGATNTPQTVAVSLTITSPTPAPEIGFSPSSFDFEAEEGGANPASQTLGIWNAGGGTLDWSVGDDAGWLDLAPTSGSSTGETDDVTVSVDISGMSAGEYDATITISAPGATNTPQTVPVSLSITVPEVPEIGFSPSSFDFEAEEGGANPASQTLSIWNAGTGTLDWSVGDDAAWLDLAPTSGSSTGETDDVTVSVDISGMSAGEYDATITITAPGATNTPQTVAVSLTITAAGPPTWTVGDFWTFDAKYYYTIGGPPHPDLNEDDTEVITVVSLDPAGTAVGGAGYVLPEDCYSVTAEFTEDPGSPPSQNPGLVDRFTVIGWVVLNPLTPPLTWNSQQTLDEVYREAWVGALFIPFEWEYLEEAAYGYVPTADHGWPYDLGKEYAMHVFAEVLIGGPGGPVLTTVNTYVIVEVVGEVVITVPAGTFTCQHVVQWLVQVIDPNNSASPPVLDVNGHWIKTGEVGSESWQSDEAKFRVRYIDRGTYHGEQVDELESYSLAP